jgi:hypothetical protein
VGHSFAFIVVVEPICAGQIASRAAENQVRIHHGQQFEKPTRFPLLDFDK